MRRSASVIGSLLLAGLLVGCGGEDESTSIVTLLLTDAPGDFEQVLVTIDEVEAAFQGQQVRARNEYRLADPAGSMVEVQQRTETTLAEDSGGEGEWLRLMEQPQTQDLLQLQEGKTAKLGEMELPAGFYHRLRVRLAKAQAVQNGVTHELEVPAAAQEGVELSFMFQLQAEKRYELVLDFDAAQSLVQAGEQLRLEPAIMVKHFRYQHMQQSSQGQN